MPRAPRVRVDPEAIARRGASWRVRWTIRNEGASALTLREAWHPHGRFHSSRLARSVRIPARGSAMLDIPARTDVRAGERIENCFLILRAIAGRAPWRILVRFAVERRAGGAPALRVKAVDVHPAED